MKKLLPCLFSLFTAFHIIGQDQGAPIIIEVDYAAIEQKIADKASKYYYPILFERYQQHDTTLSIMDYHYLYYGFTFQETYNSMLRNKNPRVEQILDLPKDSLAAFNELVAIQKDWLIQSPFDLDGIYKLYIALKASGNQVDAMIWLEKLRKLLDAVSASGDGLTVETAFHVAKVDDEYFLLEVFDFNYAGSQNLQGTCDYLAVMDNDAGVKGLYFNVERHFVCLEKLINPGKKD